MARRSSSSHHRSLGITFTGHKELDLALRNLPLQVQAKVVQAASYKAAKQIILPTAKRRAPKDTGDMASSLRARPIGRHRRTFYKGEMTGTGQMRSDNGAQVYTQNRKTTTGMAGRSNYVYHAATDLGLKNVDREPTAWLRDSLYSKANSVTLVFLREMKKFLKVKRLGNDT